MYNLLYTCWEMFLVYFSQNSKERVVVTLWNETVLPVYASGVPQDLKMLHTSFVLLCTMYEYQIGDETSW